MRRPGRTAAIILSLALAAACSRHDESKASADLKDAGHNVDSAASKVGQNADVRHVEADFKRAGHDAAQDARKLAAEAKAAAHSLAADSRNAAHQAAHSGDRDS